MQNLESLSRQDLITKTDGLVAKEREVTAELLRHLREIERRHLHLEMGFASMFELLTKHFGYSEGAAARRLNAMRLSRDVPGVAEAIQTGRLSLSAASQAHQFLVNEKKRGKTYTQAEKSRLAQTLHGKSRRDCERELLKLSPESVIPRERERVVTLTETEIRFIANAALMAKLEKLRALLGHHGSLSYAELIERLADHSLKKLDPERKQSRQKAAQETGDHVDAPPRSPAESVRKSQSQEKTAETGIKTGTSHRQAVSAADRRAIWERAGGACEYVDPVSGRRCGSRWALEIDHVLPLARGGTHERSNFRLCCKKHNLFLAVQELGVPIMGHYLRNYESLSTC